MILLLLWSTSITLSQLREAEDKGQLINGILDATVDDELTEFDDEQRDDIKEKTKRAVGKAKRGTRAKLMQLADGIEGGKKAADKEREYEETERSRKSKRDEYEDKIFDLRSQSKLKGINKNYLLSERRSLEQLRYSSGQSSSSQTQLQTSLKEINDKIREVSQGIAELENQISSLERKRKREEDVSRAQQAKLGSMRTMSSTSRVGQKEIDATLEAFRGTTSRLFEQEEQRLVKGGKRGETERKSRKRSRDEDGDQEDDRKQVEDKTENEYFYRAF